MTEPLRRWPIRGLRVLLPLAGVFLVVQYLDGLWTSAYAPANGFTSNTAFPALNLHYAVGFALAALVVLVAIVSLFTRERRTIALAVVLAASVWWAALSGSAFVRSSPNDPMYSVSMGLAFLIAFWAALMLVAFTMTRRAQETIPPTTPSTASG